jgi:hypothetical protein
MTPVLAIIVIVAVAAMLIVAATTLRNSNLQATYRRMAGQFHGHVDQEGLLGWPKATISHRNVTATVGVVRLFGQWGVRSTQIEIQERGLVVETPDESSPFKIYPGARPPAKHPALTFTCEIAPAGLLQRLAYLVGSRRPLSDSPNFDLQYSIATDSPEHTRRLLTRYVQVQIDRIRYFQGGNDVYIRFRNGLLTVSRRGVIRNERALRQFVALALELYEQAIASYGVGIEVLKVASENSADAVCKVCGDPFDGQEVVFCRVCDTPHHRDCWRYFGGCSVYACGERRFNRAPRLAPRIVP